MNIIVVGCGRVGAYLATLLSEDGHSVSVIDRHAEAFKALGHDFNGRTVKGIGFDIEVLTEAGIEECDVMVSVTSNDNTNLMTAEVARRLFHVEHVITRLYESRREKTYSQLGIDFSCGTTLVAEEIFAKIQSGHGQHIDSFGDFELVRFAFNLEKGKFLNCEMLEKNYDVRFVCVEHDDETFIARSDTKLRDGDVVVACISHDAFGDFSRYIRS